MTASDPSLQACLTYTPVPSRFGTSGVRALVENLTDLEMYCLTRGTIEHLEKTNRLRCGDPRSPMPPIPLAGDLRPSTSRLLVAAVRAVKDAGYLPDYQGCIPTPALTLYGLEKGVASLMITGSHIPADRNGLKVNRCDGELMKADEEGVAAAVESVRLREYRRPSTESVFDGRGMLKTPFHPDLPPANGKARQLYLERYRSAFPAGCLAGMRILFYQYSAVGRDLLPGILENAGASVVSVGRSDDFVPIDTEAISRSHLDMLGRLVTEQQELHGRIDAVISTDGDSDRPLIIEVRDAGSGRAGELRFFPGDLVGTVVARYLGIGAVAVPISSSPAVEECLQKDGVTVVKTRVGSPFVIEAMAGLRDRGSGTVAAWEANGGFLLGTEVPLGEGALKPLPTRDAALPILCVLHAASSSGLSLSQLFDQLPGWFGKSDLLDNFPQEDSRWILRHFSPAEAGTQCLDFDRGAVVLRGASGEVLWRGGQGERRALELRELKSQLEEVFRPELGFGEITRIDILDGLRCVFANQEIAHVRPSGNAPQLRIYAFARDQARADAIAALGVAEPHGILRTLQGMKKRYPS